MERLFKQNRNLRCGYTTGSCAAAAAKAGTVMLLSGDTIAQTCINTPKGTVLVLSISDITRSENQVTCAVRKDSGDDPDVTNGILIFVTVTKACQSGIHIYGGEGVGRVTKPGLSCSVGEPAINPVPRKMILDEVSKVCQSFGFTDGLDILISVPDGERIAQKTFNPRLGIQGGISIIGTTGIVEPMSEAALIETIRLEMNQHRESGIKNLVVCPGNYGEAFLRNTLDIQGPMVMCSNYFGEMLDFSLELGFKSVLLVGHAGKLIKLAAGIMNTHSKNADCRLELLAVHGALCGADNNIIREIMGCITTDEGIKVLNRIGLRDAVFDSLMIKIDYYLQHRVYRRVKTDVVIFSNEHGVLGKTENADKIIERMRMEDGR